MKTAAAFLKFGLMRMKRSLCEVSSSKQPLTPQSMQVTQPSIPQVVPNFYMNSTIVPQQLPSSLPPGQFYLGASAPATAPESFYMNSVSRGGNAAFSRTYLDGSDEAMNQAIHQEAEPESLTQDEEQEVYREFLQMEAEEFKYTMSLAAPRKNDGLLSICRGEHHLERMHPKHVSGALLPLLMRHYHIYILRQKPQSFGEFLSSLTLIDFCKALNFDQHDAFAAESYRRLQQGVRYLTVEKREKYNVTVRNSVLYWDKWGSDTPLDTTKPEFYKRKHSGSQVCPEGRDDAAIFVLSKCKRLYTHASKVFRFHHSSFTGGDDLVCAGDWEVADGVLKWISGASGHYRPTFENLANAVGILAHKYGINSNSYKVRCWDPAAKSFAQIPARQLMYDLSAVSSKYRVVKADH